MSDLFLLPVLLTKRKCHFFLFFRLPYIGINDYNNEVIESEFVDVPKDLKGHVIGRGGSVLQKIQQISGARVFSTSRDEEGFTVSGDEEQRSLAKMLILQKVVSCGQDFVKD